MFLGNFRLRSNSENDQREASPAENGACAFKVQSAGSQKAFHFSTTKSSGERSLSGFSRGLGGIGPGRTSGGAPDRPAAPSPPRAAGAAGAPRAPRTHRCRAAGTAWRPRSGPCLGSQGQVRRSRGSVGPSLMGPRADRVPSAHGPAGAEPPAASLTFSPTRVSQPGRPQPARRILPSGCLSFLYAD